MGATAATNLWALTGSIYALAGAALLWAATFAAPLIGSAVKDAVGASQKLDARFGAGLLTAGLFLQTTGMAVQQSAALNKSAVLMLILLAAVLLFYGGGKDLMIVEASDDASAKAAPLAEPVAIKPQLIAADPALEIEDLRTVPIRQRN